MSSASSSNSTAPGLSQLSLPDRATIANMAPEYGATCGIFPIDAETVRYLSFTNRNGALVEKYARANGLWHDDDTPAPVFSAEIELDLSTVEPSLAGPKRPQDRVSFSTAKESMEWLLDEDPSRKDRSVPIAAQDYSLHDGDLVIAAITSCTNTSNPDALVAAGLLAQNARRKGLQTKPWVKTSLAPGSQVVADYLEAAGLQTHLDALGFTIAGFGCTTCIGNSGPLKPEIAAAVDDNEMTVVAVLSGNRNFEGRISPHVKASYLASPALVVAYALAGTMRIDLTTDPIGADGEGAPVYLKDIWPSNSEISDLVRKTLKSEMFAQRYLDVFKGPPAWRNIEIAAGKTYRWDEDSTYVRRPPFFEGLSHQLPIIDDIRNARVLGIFGDSLTTDHISPAGSIKEDSPAGAYLKSKGVERGGLQQLWCPSGQSRGDDAGDLREHPHQEPDAPGQARRLHPSPPVRLGAEHLRRRDAVSGRRRSARRHRRNRVRHRVVAGLGRQGAAPAGGQGRHRGELRAHPPDQSRLHGRVAVAVR